MLKHKEFWDEQLAAAFELIPKYEEHIIELLRSRGINIDEDNFFDVIENLPEDKEEILFQELGMEGEK